MVTKAQREEWARLAEEATEGTWLVGKSALGAGWNIYHESGTDVTSPDARLDHGDARFIADAREAVPSLLRALEEAEGLIRAYLTADRAGKYADLDEAAKAFLLTPKEPTP